GVRFAQCLLEPDDAEGRRALERGGFPCVTDLVLMARPARRVKSTKNDPAGPALVVECYRDELREAFSRIVERTYEGTLDCPVLARIRSGEDSRVAHRATGACHPNGHELHRTSRKGVVVLLVRVHPHRA